MLRERRETICSCRQTGLRERLSFSFLFAGLESFLRRTLARAQARCGRHCAHHVAFYRLSRLEQRGLFLDSVGGEPCLNLVPGSVGIEEERGGGNEARDT